LNIDINNNYKIRNLFLTISIRKIKKTNIYIKYYIRKYNYSKCVDPKILKLTVIH